MREIKFRAWDKINGEMIPWGRLLNGYNLRNVFMGPEMSGLILMQFTGLEDKNCVQIYEGDIVKVISDYGWEDVSDVIFGLTDKRYGSYPAFCMPMVETESNSFSEVFDSGDYEIEVIGNIYQNKDLLEEEE